MADLSWTQSLTLEAAQRAYKDAYVEPDIVARDTVVRALCKQDLFFLLCYVLRRPDAISQFVYARCREVQANPDGYLDLWAREFYKSTVLTFALTIQDILNNPEITVVIFSQTRPAAKKFLRQIKVEFEENTQLKNLFKDVLWDNPQKEAPKWALDINTKILTTSGWKCHGDLRYGDKIFGSAGQVIKVISNSGPMTHLSCRKVVFDDCELVASAEHLWPVNCKPVNGPWKENPKTVVVTTDELPIKNKTRRLPATPSIHPPAHELPFDPYLLGYWLGNGTAGTNIITVSSQDEADILGYIDAVGFETYVHRKKPEDNFAMYGVGNLKHVLFWLGCLREKHIPEGYLLGSESERLALLQGLMDSDGTCKKDGPHKSVGMCMFSNTNYNLASGVFQLAASLGLRPSIGSFKRKDAKWKQVYQVYFVGIKSTPPFRLARKLNNCKEKRHMAGRYVQSVMGIPSVAVNCIKVDAVDGLYLAGESMVVTHNSEDDGLVVKRKNNPKEGTLEAVGLVDGQPAGPHWDLCVYDDVVTKTSVTTPEMIAKTNEMWELSLPLSKVGGRRRYVGTYYHYSDTYHLIEKRGAAIIRKYPATLNGMADGEPVYMPREELAKRRREWGEYTFNCQMLLNPTADGKQGFKKEWLRYWKAENFSNLNTTILCDPAGTRKKRSGHDPDYTVFILLGYGSDKNIYICDMVRDRLTLTERADVLFAWHRKYRPMTVGYEKYGKDSDIEHYNDKMDRENYRFEITELGGITSKAERIGALVPDFEQGHIYLPESILYTNSEGKERDLIEDFINEEYLAYPVATHDDILDALARVHNPAIPKIAPNTGGEGFVPNRLYLVNGGVGRRGWTPRRTAVG